MTRLWTEFPYGLPIARMKAPATVPLIVLVTRLVDLAGVNGAELLLHLHEKIQCAEEIQLVEVLQVTKDSR